MDDRKIQLHQEILGSFPIDPLPLRKDLDFDKDHEELGFLFDHGFPRKYSEVTFSEYDLAGDAIFFLTGRAFAYYVAGFLLSALNMDACETDLHSRLIETFILRGKDKDHHSHARTRIRQLNPSQIVTIRKVLEEIALSQSSCIDERDINTALDSLDFHQLAEKSAS